MISVYISPHIDDIVIGATQFLIRDKNAKYLIHTTNDMPNPNYYPEAYTKIPLKEYKNRLVKEKKLLYKTLNITKGINLNIEDGKAFQNYNKLKKNLLFELKKLNPGRIIFPTLQGSNIDHEIVSYIIREYSKTHTNKIFYEYAIYHVLEKKHLHNQFSYGTDNKKILTENLYKLKCYLLDNLQTKSSDTVWFYKDNFESVRKLEHIDVRVRPNKNIIYEEMSGIPFEKVIELFI